MSGTGFDAVAPLPSLSAVIADVPPRRRESKTPQEKETYFEWGLKVLDKFEYAASLSDKDTISKFIELFKKYTQSSRPEVSSTVGSELASAALLFKPVRKFTKSETHFLLALLYRQIILCIKTPNPMEAHRCCDYALAELKTCTTDFSPDATPKVALVSGEICLLLGDVLFNQDPRDANVIKNYKQARLHLDAAIRHSKPSDTINTLAHAKKRELELALSNAQGKRDSLVRSLQTAGLEGDSEGSCSCVIL